MILHLTPRQFFAVLTILVSTTVCGTLPLASPALRQEQQEDASTANLPETVSFNAHIRPIMSNTCFACHGPDDNANHSGVRLDSFDAAVDEAGVIEPGDSDSSVLYERLIDPDDPMPPADFRHQLSDYEKALFKKWIDQGAEYQEHWSYAPLRKPEVPQGLKFADRIANPIDAFVLRRLELEGIEPTEQADKATLLRRLSLDLIGLPPSIEELNAFLNDDSPEAWEKQVDRLLASPKYGERMASRWLDIVRFSDTVGFHGDQNQRIFPYRDYVINSLNDNQPFDEFTREQLAGDLLKNPTDQQLVATGLIRLNMMTREGGAQPGEYLAKYTADRVRMIGTAWLGATTGCCECHNHKYDPFTIQDFYSLGAFFDDVRQWGVYHDYGYTPNPDLKGYSNDHPFPPEMRIESAPLKSQIRYLEGKLHAIATGSRPETGPGFDAFSEWLNQLENQFRKHKDNWAILNPVSVKTKVPERTISGNDRDTLFPDPPRKNQQIEILLQSETPLLVRSLQLEVLPSVTHNGKVGRSPEGRFSAALSITHQPRVDRPENDPVKLIPVTPRYVRIELPGKGILSLAEVQVHIASGHAAGPTNIAGDGEASQSSVENGGDAARAIDGNTSGKFTNNSTTRTQNENNPWWELDLGNATSIEKITIWNRTDGNEGNRLRGFRIVLLDENREPLYRCEPQQPSPNVEVSIPQKVSELDLLPPAKISLAQADRFRTNRFSNGHPSPFIQGRWESGPSRWQLPANETELSHHAVFHLNEPILLQPEDRLLIKLDSNDVGRIRFSVSPVSRMVAGEKAIPDALNRFLKVATTNEGWWDKPVPPSLKSAWSQYNTPLDKESNEVKQTRHAIAECRSGLAMTMVSQPIEAEKIKTSRVLPRGNWQDESGAVVGANTPHFLAGYNAKPEQRLTRLDLADWLTSTDNPMTARHYVNRTWKHFLGAGISNVLDDLGNQGEWPSHPELLDWLASEFATDWDRKKITRLIVTSNTYRQKAAVRGDLRTRDPYNRLLAQQSARRLEAETVRDNALAISGLLLDDWIGGPSVHPFQPAGYYANLQFPNRKYQPNNDGRQYRRGIYMHWQRTFLHPMLANFNAPSRDECTADRTVSNSPQQALTLLNDPVFVEASRALAVLVREEPGDFARQLDHAFLLALSRKPTRSELQTLQKLYDKQLDYFQQNPAAATTFQSTGQLTVSPADAVAVAAMAQVCRVILNLHETITRF